MRRFLPALVALAVLAEAQPSPEPRASPAPAGTPARAPKTEDERWADATRVAWRYFEQQTVAPSGFARAVPRYAFVTTWDVGSHLLAVHSAHGLGLIDDAELARRAGAILRTLEKARLFDGAAYNKSYSSAHGAMVDRRQRTSTRGYGWSALDLGRLLVALHVIREEHPALAEKAERAARRIDFSRVVRDGYLRGAEIDPKAGVTDHQEGRLGYEQYAAMGFAAWGADVGAALDVERNTASFVAGGRKLRVDFRGDRLTSEPFVLAGLELGLDGELERLASEILGAQEDRFRATGQVTIVSEDALPRPPYHFFYYSVFAQGRMFETVVHDPAAILDGPRWVSAKAAFAWSALRPGAYTRRAVEAVGAARTAGGWAAGVFEGNGRSTGAVNLNTNAVILEAALVRKRGGRPLAPARGLHGSRNR